MRAGSPSRANPRPLIASCMSRTVRNSPGKSRSGCKPWSRWRAKYSSTNRLIRLIVLDPTAPADEEGLDKAVRAAASLCVNLAGRGGCAVLLPGERRPIEIGQDMGAWPGVHVRLALVESGSAPPAATLGPRGGAVIWVTGADLQSAPRALERLPAGARIVVSPAALPGVRPLFEVAECTGCLVERLRRVAPVGAGRAA